MVKVLKGQGIPIVAITGREDSFLARNAEEIILVSDKSDSDFKSPIIEEISMLSIINSIYLVYSLFLNSLEGP
ncbi:RpiR family transcriptional regulator [Niallia nealsonii AAU1]|nr:RpiR family transcriptional regulator [Niallia nealsonii AAU1]